MDDIRSIISMLGTLFIVIGILIAGARIVITSRNAKERGNSMKSLLYIMIGAFIIGGVLLIAGYINTMKDSIVTGLDSAGISPSIPSELTQATDDEGNFLVRALTLPLTLVVTFLEFLFKNISTFKPLDQLIFNYGVTDTTHLPFTTAEWTNINTLYKMIAGIVGSLLLIMVAKTGFSYIINAGSTAKRAELKEDIQRWFLSIFAIGLAPIFVEGLTFLTNEMVNALYGMVQNTLGGGGVLYMAPDFISQITTGNVLTTSIIKILYLYIELTINIIFMVRKIVITVLYVFTPIAAVLWGINKKVTAAQIWMGEMITNITAPFFYAFTLFIMLATIGSSSKNWFVALLWMFSIKTISEMLRNSLQGIFLRLAGINEAAVAGSAIGTVGRLFNGTKAAFSETAKPMTYGTMSGMYGGGKPYTSDNAKASSGGATMGSKTASAEHTSGGGTMGSSSSTGSWPTGDGSTSGNETSFAGSTGNNPLVNTAGGMMGNSMAGNGGGFKGASEEAFGGKESSFKMGSNMYGMAKDATGEYQVFDEEKNPGFVKKNMKDWATQDKYGAMLYNNLNKEHLKQKKDWGKAVGNNVGGFGKMLLGYDPGFSAIAQGIGNVSGNIANRVQRSSQAATAIKSTVKQMQTDYKNETGKVMTDREALDKLFGPTKKVNGKDTNIRDNQLRFMNAYGKRDIQSADRALMQQHPYVNVDGFTWRS